MPQTSICIVALCLLVLGLSTARAEAGVPRDWMGVVLIQAPVVQRQSKVDTEIATMARNGVRSVRMPVYWNVAQPYRHLSSIVPSQQDRFEVSHGVPTDFSVTDQIMAAVARRRMTLLPTVLGAPPWAGGEPGRNVTQPRNPADYARYLTTLVERYGPQGTFWDDNPGLPFRPIRQWQVWNEPDRIDFWKFKGHGLNAWATPYVRLLRASHQAIKRSDPGATVMLAGLPGYAWFLLDDLYRAGARGLFDVVAVHPYTLRPDGVLAIVSNCRGTLAKYHDTARPIAVTETSWPASKGRVPRSEDETFSVTPRQQAQRLSTVFRLLAAARRRMRISGVYWVSWATSYRGAHPFDYVGLRKVDATGTARSTPLLATYARTARLLARGR